MTSRIHGDLMVETNILSDIIQKFPESSILSTNEWIYSSILYTI